MLSNQEKATLPSDNKNLLQNVNKIEGKPSS